MPVQVEWDIHKRLFIYMYACVYTYIIYIRILECIYLYSCIYECILYLFGVSFILKNFYISTLCNVIMFILNVSENIDFLFIFKLLKLLV